MFLVIVAGVLVPAMAALVVSWLRSEPRMHYRVDRARYRRLQRRWSGMSRHLDERQAQGLDVTVRGLEHWLELARQSLRSRRRSTGLVSYTRQLREPTPVRLEVPFERTYLFEATRALDAIQVALAPTGPAVVDVRSVPGDSPTTDSLARPA